MLNQLDRILLQIAEARRMHGTSERDGTVHQVWRQNKEQKIRLNMGTRPDGSPWLSPWIKIEDHHGALRQQHKFHEGQNVKLTTNGSDFSQAKVTPAGENNAHPEPVHADDINETSQYGTYRHRIGPDFHESWLAANNDNTTGSSSSSAPDPDKNSVAVVRTGAKPQQQQDKDQPWEGPDPNAGSAQKRHMTWVGSEGNTPAQNGDVITHQFDKDAKREITLGNILQKVQSSDGAAMQSPDAGDGAASRTTTDNMADANILRKIHDLVNQLTTSSAHASGGITHIIMDAVGNIVTKSMQKNQIIHQLQDSNGNFSSIMQQASQVFHQVTSGGQTSVLQITGSAINLNSQSVNINTEGFNTPTTPPAIPSLASNGTAPLVHIPQLWSIECGIAISGNLLVTPIGYHLFVVSNLATGAADLVPPVFHQVHHLGALNVVAGQGVFIGKPGFLAV